MIGIYFVSSPFWKTVDCVHLCIHRFSSSSTPHCTSWWLLSTYARSNTPLLMCLFWIHIVLHSKYHFTTCRSSQIFTNHLVLNLRLWFKPETLILWKQFHDWFKKNYHVLKSNQIDTSLMTPVFSLFPFINSSLYLCSQCSVPILTVVHFKKQ